MKSIHRIIVKAVQPKAIPKIDKNPPILEDIPLPPQLVKVINFSESINHNEFLPGRYTDLT